eukprot:1627811-Heterocapsa_arctica.AAC.1
MLAAARGYMGMRSETDEDCKTTKTNHDAEGLYNVTNGCILLHEAMKDANNDIDTLAERWKR